MLKQLLFCGACLTLAGCGTPTPSSLVTPEKIETTRLVPVEVTRIVEVTRVVTATPSPVTQTPSSASVAQQLVGQWKSALRFTNGDPSRAYSTFTNQIEFFHDGTYLHGGLSGNYTILSEARLKLEYAQGVSLVYKFVFDGATLTLDNGNTTEIFQRANPSVALTSSPGITSSNTSKISQCPKEYPCNPGQSVLFSGQDETAIRLTITKYEPDARNIGAFSSGYSAVYIIMTCEQPSGETCNLTLPFSELITTDEIVGGLTYLMSIGSGDNKAKMFESKPRAFKNVSTEGWAVFRTPDKSSDLLLRFTSPYSFAKDKAYFRLNR